MECNITVQEFKNLFVSTMVVTLEEIKGLPKLHIFLTKVAICLKIHVISLKMD